MTRTSTDQEVMETAAHVLRAIAQWPAARLDNPIALVRQIARVASTFGYATQEIHWGYGRGVAWNADYIENGQPPNPNPVRRVIFFLPSYAEGVGWGGRARVDLEGKVTDVDAIKLLLGLVAYLEG
ncbi:MAG TPA: hypothetical protein VFT87_00630 [Candidatus Saccharimonadales bacterium]|nr:hypothetical protein [Candidatus Saccharimonadales bacterium]